MSLTYIPEQLPVPVTAGDFFLKALLIEMRVVRKQQDQLATTLASLGEVLTSLKDVLEAQQHATDLQTKAIVAQTKQVKRS